MPKETKTASAELRELEKLVKKIIRKSLKDNTLDYTVQATISNLEPGEIKYAAMISSPAKGVQPITFVFDTFEQLKAALVESETAIDKQKVEVTFHQSRINSYKNRIEAHEARIKQIESGEADEDEEAIELEEV